MVSSAGKVMASVFRDAKGIVFINYLQNGKTINGEYYAKLLKELRQAIKSKRPGKLTKSVLHHQENAPAHKSLVAMSAVHDRGFELIDHPPYSPDLAPSDYFLFPNLKKHLAGKQYESDHDVISAVEDFLRVRRKTSMPPGPENCSTDGRNVWTAKEIMLKNKPTLVKFKYFVLVRL